MSESPEFPPDYYCPNPDKDCPGNGADLMEVREPIKDEDGTVLAMLITMACRVCGYRWENES